MEKYSWYKDDAHKGETDDYQEAMRLSGLDQMNHTATAATVRIDTETGKQVMGETIYGYMSDEDMVADEDDGSYTASVTEWEASDEN